MPNMPLAMPVLSSKGEDVYNFLRMSERAKQYRQSSSWVYRQFYVGNGFYDLDVYSSQVMVDEALLTGVPYNVSGTVIDRARSVVLGAELSLEGMPRTMDAADKRSAQVVTEILKDHDLRNSSGPRLHDIVADVLITGTGFRRIAYDKNYPEVTILTPEQLQVLMNMGIAPMAVNPMADGKLRVMLPIGATTEHRVPADLVYAETGVSNWEDVRRFAVVQYLPIASARQMFPEFDPEAWVPMNIYNTLAANVTGTYASALSSSYNTRMQQAGDQIPTEYKVTWIVEYWERSGYRWDRRVLTGLRLDRIVLDRQTLPINPYIMYSCGPQFDLWTKGMMQDIYKLQLSINRLYTRKLQYLSECVKDVVMTPFGAKTSPITNEYNLIIQYDPTFGPPVFKPMDGSTLNVLRDVERDLESGIYKLSGVNDVAMGSVKPRTSRFAIEAAVSAADSPLMSIRTRIKEAERLRGKVVAAFAREEYDYPRLAKVTGDFGSAAIREFTASDIILGTDVTIIESEASLRSKEERLDAALQLSRFGVFDMSPEARDRRQLMRGFIESGNLNEIYPIEERQAEDQALLENEAILSGQFQLLPPEAEVNDEGQPIINAPLLAWPDMNPFVYPDQYHEVHVRVHEQKMQDPGVDPQVRQLLQLHIDAHRFFIRQDEEASFQAELERRRQMAIADAAGTLMTTVASADAAAENKGVEVKKDPTAGGIESGKVRGA